MPDTKKNTNPYCEITPQILALKTQWEAHNYIDPQLFQDYGVKRGLRDENGRGVLTGLTRVSEICAYTMDEQDRLCSQEGMLYYRGIDVRELVRGAQQRGRFGYEETAYLLLFGELPTASQLASFCSQLADYRTLPTNFFRDVIMKGPNPDLMNSMQRSVLTLFCYDDRPNDIDLTNVLRQSLQLIANFPVLAVYAYQACRAANGESLFIHRPRPELSTAENILYMLREGGRYTDLEARALDAALILHADNGGGNNSTFTNHVVTSSGTDTYAAVAASLSSLKGPRHGSANSKVMEMMDDIALHVPDWTNEDALLAYLSRILLGEAFDGLGLLYGLGHAVYTTSDPRCEVFRQYVKRLAAEKGANDRLGLYERVERLGKHPLAGRSKKEVSTNIDFYSGFAYELLGFPRALYTPIFAVARIAGWSAHRMEELSTGGKLIRPRYECVEPHRPYVPMEQRREAEP